MRTVGTDAGAAIVHPTLVRAGSSGTGNAERKERVAMEVGVRRLPERIDESEVLDRTADLIERSGWRQLSASDAGTGDPARITVPDAINQTILRRYESEAGKDLPARRQIVAERMDVEHVLACWLLDTGLVPKRWEYRFPLDHIVLEWNERSGQSQEQIVTALRAAALRAAPARA